MNWSAKDLKKECIKKCRKHCPAGTSAREYITLYLLSFYPDIYDSDTGRWVDNDCFFSDFGMRLDQLAERLAKIYYRIYLHTPVIDDGKVFIPNEENFTTVCRIGDYVCFFTEEDKSTDHCYLYERINKRWLNEVTKPKQSIQLTLL